MKVLSYNIHKGYNAGNIKFLLEEIRAGIRLVDADFVFLQEVCGKNEKGKVVDPDTVAMSNESQFEFLADSVWPHFAYGKNAIYPKGDHGNSILSQFPITDWYNLDLSIYGFSQRGALHAIVSIPEGKKERRVHLICVHLGLFEHERREQSWNLIEYIKEKIPAKDPFILAGDFNDWRYKSDKLLVRELALIESYRSSHGQLARSYPALFPLLQVDRIYCRGMSVEHSEALGGAPWNRLSDHLALYAEFKFNSE